MRKIIFILFLMVGLCLNSSSVKADTSTVEVNKMTVEMDVEENGLVHINTIMNVNFLVPQHGLILWLPQKYDVMWDLDGEIIERSYLFPISSIIVNDEPYIVSEENNGLIKIRIGSDIQTYTGEKTYEYTYDLKLKDLDLKGKQFFYMNIVGTDFKMIIHQVDFKITLPKGWPHDVSMTVGLKGSTTPLSSYEINGNVLEGSYTEGLSPNEGITIFTLLSDKGDYFDFTGDNHPWLGLIMMGVLSLIISFIYLRYGRDEPLIITPEFDPIPGLSVSQIGYIVDGETTVSDIMALVIEWGYKGYLRITENDSDGFFLTKIKDINKNEIEADQYFFNEMFYTKNEVSSLELQEFIPNHALKAASLINNYFESNDENQIYDIKSNTLKYGLASLLMFPLVVECVINIYSVWIESSLIGAFSFGFYLLGTVLFIVFIYYIQHWNAMTKHKQQVWISILATSTLFIFIGVALIYFNILNKFDVYILLRYIVITLLILTNLGMIVFLDRRTKKGTYLMGRVLGLKNYIENVEKDKLEALVYEDPTYFFKLLPYAAVLGVSDVWSKKFTHLIIKNPPWILDTYSKYQTFDLYRLTRMLQHSFTSSSHSSSHQSSTNSSVSSGIGGALIKVVIRAAIGGHSGGGFGGGGGDSW
jgi:hypothetical protein